MERITLNMVPTGVLEICHASQYDIGREIRFDLINGTDDFVLSGDEDITIFIRDFDGNLIESSAPNTSSNYVVWTSSEGELDVSGPAICELRVTKDDDVLGSANFIMEIEADAYDGKGIHVETVGPADICTFETTLPEPLQSVIVDIEATGGNGTPDSPIPINGYTEANIIRCGVNLWDEVWENGSINPTTGVPFNDPDRIRSKNYSPIKGGIEIYTIDPTNNGNIRLFYYDENKNYISPSGWLGNQTSTIPESACYFKFIMGTQYGRTYNHDISVLYPSSEHNYHAYNGDNIVIDLDGTRYGGNVHYRNGKWYFEGTKKKIVLDGNTPISDIGVGVLSRYTQVSYMPFISEGLDTSEFMSNIFESVPASQAGLYKIYPTSVLGSPRMFLGLPNSVTTREEAVSWFSANPTEVVYELANPVTIELDVSEPMFEALLGVNNVWHDGNGNTEVKYLEVVRS